MKSILVFSNGEKIGDGIIKLPLLNELKRRLPNYELHWMTDQGSTVYSTVLKHIASRYINHTLEKVNLNLVFSRKICKNFDLENKYFDIIFDTQKSVLRTLALKRIKHKTFVSSSASGIFSDIKLSRELKGKKKYYLENLYDLLDLIIKMPFDKNFKFPINSNVEIHLKKIFEEKKNYVGIAPGAGEKNKIWPLNNFIQVGNYLINKGYHLVFYLGPQELEYQNILKNIFKEGIFLEENILLSKFKNIDIVMASTKFLKFAISNDSGVSHMLSTNYCYLIKLFGPKDSQKFTPKTEKLITISSSETKSNKIEDIKISKVIKTIEEIKKINV